MILIKIFLVILLLAIIPTISFCQLPTVETMEYTANFQSDTLTGTCFLINKDEKKYLVTAAHLFKTTDKTGDVVPIAILIGDTLESFDAKVYFHTDPNVDVAVMKLVKYDYRGEGITLDTTRLSFGLQVFFYGFPLRNLGTEIPGIKFPLVKTAILSGQIKYNGVDV